jgi:hypothetical protein
MKSISITILLCFSFGLIQRANAQDNCETLTAKVNALYIQLNTQKNTQNNCVMQKNAATESWKAAKNRRDKNGMATAELAANSAEQQWKAAGTEIDKTNRSIKFAEDRQKTVCKKEKAAAGNVNRPNDGIPSMNIMSVGWYPKGTTTTLNGSVYDIGGFTEQQRISLKGTSDRFSSQTNTNDEYRRIKPFADKNLLTKSVETSGSTSIANPTAQKSLPAPPSTPPASGAMPPKPTAPKSAAVGTVAPTPATTTSTPKAPPLPSTAPPATTTSTPKAPPLPSTPPPAIPNTPSTSPNTIVPQNEAQKKELELRQMQTAEAIKNKQTTTTAPSTFGGTAPAATSTSSSFGTAPASAPANNPSSATASNPTTTSNPTAAPKTGGYGSNASTTTPANTAASNQYPASTPKTGQAGLIEGIPSQTINSYGWYPRGTSMMLQSFSYDISGFTQVDVDRLRSTSGRYSNPARTRSEYDGYKLKTAKTLESSDRQDAQKGIVFSGNEPWLKAIREATDANFASVADAKKLEMRQMKANYTGNNKYILEAYDRNIKTIDEALSVGTIRDAERKAQLAKRQEQARIKAAEELAKRPKTKVFLAWEKTPITDRNSVEYLISGSNPILTTDFEAFCSEKAVLNINMIKFLKKVKNNEHKDPAKARILYDYYIIGDNNVSSPFAETNPEKERLNVSVLSINAAIDEYNKSSDKPNERKLSVATWEKLYNEMIPLQNNNSVKIWNERVENRLR